MQPKKDFGGLFTAQGLNFLTIFLAKKNRVQIFVRPAPPPPTGEKFGTLPNLLHAGPSTPNLGKKVQTLLSRHGQDPDGFGQGQKCSLTCKPMSHENTPPPPHPFHDMRPGFFLRPGGSRGTQKKMGLKKEIYQKKKTQKNSRPDPKCPPPGGSDLKKKPVMDRVKG